MHRGHSEAPAKSRRTMAAFFLLIVSGCSVAGSANLQPDTVRLSLRGDFLDTPPDILPRRDRFELLVHSPSNAPEEIAIYRYGLARPEVGHYAISAPDPDHPDSPGFLAIYQRPASPPNDTARMYRSIGGELVISKSAPELVEGSFHFTGAEYYATWPPDGRRGAGENSKVTPNTRPVEVIAQFSAVQVKQPFTAIAAPGRRLVK